MNKLIYKTVFFLLPVLLVLVSIELFYRIIPNNYTLKNDKIKGKYSITEVLIFGNSHTFYGLNPIFFNKPTFNISNISQSLYFDKLLFDKHFNNFKKLKCIILNVEYFSLSQLDNTDEDVWRKYYYKSYMNLNVPIISPTDPTSFFLSSTRNFNTNVKLISRYLTEGTITDCDENGFGINYTKENKQAHFDIDTPITIKRHEDNLIDFTNNITQIQSIIDKCKKNSVKVIIVTMPVSRNYARSVNQFKLNKIFNSCLLLEKANNNVYYLNLFNDTRFTDDNFYDPDHLHNEGAKKCSIIMNDYVLKVAYP